MVATPMTGDQTSGMGLKAAFGQAKEACKAQPVLRESHDSG
jgi:hypothetical protein